MKKYLILCLAYVSAATCIAQDYAAQARQFQLSYKDDEAIFLDARHTYEFSPGEKAEVQVSEKWNRQLMSLRYNQVLSQTDVYNSNSQVLKLAASSNLKQKAPDKDKFCGRYTEAGLFFDDSWFCSQRLRSKEIGEVWSVECSKEYFDARYLTRILLQDEYPILEKKLTFILPAGIDAEILQFNLDSFQVTRSERSEGGKRYIEFVAKNLPALKTDRAERGIMYNRPHLLVLLKSIQDKGTRKNILSNTQDLYRWSHSLVRQLKPDPQVFRSTVESLTRDQQSEEDKIKAIYYWVQDNVRYIAFEDGIAAFKPAEAQDVFTKRYGDCKGMANLLKEMLKQVGFDARLTWIGTKRILYDQSLPSLASNNHMICTLFWKGKKYFLDGTENYVAFGENAYRIQDRQALIEDGDNYLIEQVPREAALYTEQKRSLQLQLLGENLSGRCELSLRGETKKDFLHNYHFTELDKRQEYLKTFMQQGNRKMDADSLRLPNLEERSGPLSMSSRVNIRGAVSSFGNELYVDPDPFKVFQNLELKAERQGDLDFGERVNEITEVEILIPAGYSAAELPENLDIQDPEFSFQLKYSKEADRIRYSSVLRVPEGFVSKKSFGRWNEAVRKLSKAYGRQIVLKK